MEPEVPWQTWREKQRPPKLTRRQFAVGCASLSLYGAAILIALVLGIVVPLALMTVGINELAGWMLGLLGTPPIPALVGIAMIVLAAWLLFRVATGHSLPGTPLSGKILAVVTSVILALIGLALVLAVVAPEPEPPRF
jgi:uncharacterized BrkB/YihY/UPF0761 family membrane protein